MPINIQRYKLHLLITLNLVALIGRATIMRNAECLDDTRAREPSAGPLQRCQYSLGRPTISGLPLRRRSGGRIEDRNDSTVVSATVSSRVPRFFAPPVLAFPRLFTRRSTGTRIRWNDSSRGRNRARDPTKVHSDRSMAQARRTNLRGLKRSSF